MPVLDQGREKRREDRIPISALTFPFIGVRHRDFFKFQYRLVDASPSGAQIAIPEYVNRREMLKSGDEFSFFLSMMVGEKCLEFGRIRWLRIDEDTMELACGVLVNGGGPIEHFLQVNLVREGEYVFLQPINLPDLRWYIADTIVEAARGKKTIASCLTKLALLYPGGTFIRDQFPGNPSLTVNAIAQEIRDQATQLEAVANRMRGILDAREGIEQFLNFGILRPILDSDLYQNVLSYSFQDRESISLSEEMKQIEGKILFYHNSLALAAVLIVI